MIKAVKPEDCTLKDAAIEEAVQEKVDSINQTLLAQYHTNGSVTFNYNILGKGRVHVQVRKAFEQVGWEIKQTWCQRDNQGWTTFTAKK